MPMKAVYTTMDGEVLSQVRDGISSMMLPDPQKIAVDLEYWPFEEKPSAGSQATPFRFGGKVGYYSDTSGRLYVRARYYRAVTGRWMTVDPLWPHQLAYSYCACMPISCHDRSGRSIDCPEGHPIFTAYSALKARMGPICKSKLNDIKDCWKQCGEHDWEKEGECFCNHVTGAKGYKPWIVCRNLAWCQGAKDSLGNPIYCMGTIRGSWKTDCNINICDDPGYLGACPPTIDWEAALFHEMMHCCGASHDPRNWDCQAKPDCLEKCLRKVASWPMP